MEFENDTRQTVMVVDDIEDIRALLRAQLTTLGYKVIEASNGLEAIESARRYSPALILMDLTMPILDGFSATQRIREDAAIRRAVIVAFTALQSDESRKRALEAGCDDFIKKPLSMKKLQALMSHHLPRRPARSLSPTPETGAY